MELMAIKLPNLTVKIILTLFAIFLIVYPLINMNNLDGELSFIMIIAGVILLIYILTEEYNKEKKRFFYYKKT